MLPRLPATADAHPGRTGTLWTGVHEQRPVDTKRPRRRPRAN